MKVTIRDVAAKAGVSAMAVSSVLHGSGKNVKISEEKAQIIRDAARELNYHPNRLARIFRNNRTNCIGVVFQHFSRLSGENPYYPQLLNGITAALFPADYTLALCPKLTQSGDVGAILDGRFDGILWCRPDFTQASIDTVRNANLPIVMMHAPPGTAPGVATFCADNEKAMSQVVAHLTGLGHKRIGFVVDPVTAMAAEATMRFAGFQRAMAEAGLQGEQLIWNHEAAELTQYRLGRGPHTALVAFSDFVAGRLMSACQRFDVRVPQDVSIIGFDSSSFCDTFSPRLTSVYQPVERIAYDATAHLLSLIRAESPEEAAKLPIATLYDCSLDIRESTSPPYPEPTRIYR